MELGQFEMGYSILAPCIFSLYLHPDDYTRLTGVFDLIREDAKKALEPYRTSLNKASEATGAEANRSGIIPIAFQFHNRVPVLDPSQVKRLGACEVLVAHP